MTEFTIPGLSEKDGNKVADLLQKQLSTYNDLHLTLTTLPSFRYAAWEVMPLIPFHRDIEMSLDDALARAKESSR